MILSTREANHLFKIEFMVARRKNNAFFPSNVELLYKTLLQLREFFNLMTQTQEAAII